MGQLTGRGSGAEPYSSKRLLALWCADAMAGHLIEQLLGRQAVPCMGQGVAHGLGKGAPLGAGAAVLSRGLQGGRADSAGCNRFQSFQLIKLLTARVRPLMALCWAVYCF